MKKILFLIVLLILFAADAALNLSMTTQVSDKNQAATSNPATTIASAAGLGSKATTAALGSASTSTQALSQALTQTQTTAKRSVASARLAKFQSGNEEKAVLLSAAGDCVLGGDETYSYQGSFIERFYLENKNYAYFLKDVQQIFGKDDLTVVNLETTLTNASKKMDKEFRFKGLPEFSNILSEGNVEVANIANNHIRDYLKQGYEDTVRSLKSAGVGYYGDGLVYGKTINGVKVCLLGYRVWDETNYMKNKIKRDVEYYKNKGYDLVIVSFHWGVEWTNLPTSLQQNVGRLALDAGADLVIGHHPHVMQSIEKYKNKFIVYSLGNFSYGGIENPKDKDTFLFQQKFDLKNGKLTADARVIPCLISTAKTGNDYKPVPVAGVDKKRILERLNEYSNSFGVKITDEGILE